MYPMDIPGYIQSVRKPLTNTFRATRMKRSATIPLTQQTTITRSGTSRTYGSKRSRATTSSRKPTYQTASMVRFSGYGFPEKLQVKHRYFEYTALAAAAGSKQVSQYRCNGMYDPNHSGTGHQPLYFDQLAAVYDHFTVLRSYLKLTVSTSSSNPQQVVVYINDDTTVTPSSIETCAEQSTAKYCVISNATASKTFYIPWDAKRTFGGSILANDNLQGTAAADPVEQSLFTIAAQAVDVAQPTSVLMNVEIVYTAVWDELKDIASS